MLLSGVVRMIGDVLPGVILNLHQMHALTHRMHTIIHLLPGVIVTQGIQSFSCFCIIFSFLVSCLFCVHQAALELSLFYQIFNEVFLMIQVSITKRSM